MKLYDDPEQEQHVWEVREAGLGATAFLPGQAGHVRRAGRTRRSRPSGSATTCATCASSATSTATRARSTGTTAGLRPRALELRPLERGRDRGTTARFVDEARRPRRLATAARSRASTATASRAAELLPKMFGPELVEAFREFKAIWDPGLEDEPRQGRRPVSARPRTSASAPRLQPAAGRRRTSPSRTTTAPSPTRRPAASASASAGAPTAA